MKRTVLSRIAVLWAVSSASGFLAGCGGGINTPTVQGSVAVTQNPLVAQYNLVTGCSGPAMIEFGPDTSYGRATAWYPLPGLYKSFPIEVAGMRASTTYHMRPQVQCGSETIMGSDTTFTTGALPSIQFPIVSVTRPHPSLSSLESPGIESITVPVAGTPALFTDRDAHPIWYYDVGAGSYPFTFKILPSGNVILSITATGYSLLREVDLAGNTIREMNIFALKDKMRTAGINFDVGGFHHDVLPLDNGHLLVLLTCSQTFTDLAGYTGTVLVEGDAIVDLDADWNPVWSWNSFDHLEVNRHLQPVLTAGTLDWTHSNALVYSPSDENVLISMRHQSWVLKLDYNNGSGSGNIIWKLGYQGDFALTENGVPTSDPSIWFSFQHFPIILNQNGSQTDLAIWDNGDNRVLDTSGSECLNPEVGTPPCYSRATLFQIDESAMTANLTWSDLQTDYSIWGGSINQMENGNVEFDLNSPIIQSAPNLASQVKEVTQTSNPQVVWEMNFTEPYFAYRAYRVPSLYNGVTWQY